MAEKQLTMEEKIIDAFLDECKGVACYAEMAKEAPEKYAPILRDISREEHVHMEHIKKIMDDMGIAMTDELKEAHGEAETAYKSLSR